MKKLLFLSSTFLATAAFLQAGWNNTSSTYSFSGKVGVGTQSPQEKFHVKNGNALIEGSSWTWLKIKTSASEKDTGVKLYDYNGDFWYLSHDVTDNNMFNIGWNYLNLLQLNTAGDLLTKNNIRIDGKNLFFEEYMRLIGGGDGMAWLNFRSDSTTDSEFKLSTKSEVFLGELRGAVQNSEFGLRDADSDWILKSKKDESISFSIDGDEKMKIEADGAVTISRIPPQGDVLMGDFTE